MASSTQRAAAQRTATYVQAVLRAGHGKRRRTQPKPQWPFALEREYATDLVGIIKDLHRQTDAALAQLPALIESARHEREDAADREVLGLHVVIENPAGSIRTWIDADGTTGTTVMRSPYGYLDGYEGADGEDVDVYVGPELEPAEVYVVHQQRKAGDAEVWPDYDEDKVMLGWASADAAKAAYLEQYDDPRFFGGMSVFTAADFKRQLVANPGRKLTHADPRVRVLRVDVGEGRRARMLMDLSREGLGGTAAKAESAAGSVAKQVGDFQKKQLGKQSEAALGVDITPLLKNPKYAAMIDAFVHENVSLVKSLGSKSLDDLEKIITRGLADGKRAAAIGAEIQKRWGIAERHARLIARDQIGKLNGQLTRVRHAELGIPEFRWLTMKDPLVRPTHKTKEGLVFAYKGPDAPPFFPGEEVCCRCGEEPLFDDILSLLDSMMADATPTQPAAAVDTSGLESVRTPAVPVLPGLADEVLAEHARAEAARAAAVAAAKEDLVAFNAHTANEKVWAAKVQAAKEKQAKALEDLKAKMAGELAAKKAQEEAAKAAQEAAQKAALAAQQAAELAAKKAASAAKAKATRAANKAKKEALAATASPAPTAAPTPAGQVRYSSFKPDDFAGFHGRGFVQDADAIEGGSVRVVKVHGPDGEYFESVFKMTSPFGDRARSYGTESRTDWQFRQREHRNGELHDLGHTEAMPNASTVRRGARAGNTVEIGAAGALTNQVRIRARSLAELDAQMADFSKHVGLDLQKEPAGAELELQAKARLAAKFDPKAFGSRMENVKTPEQHRQVIEDVFAAAAQRHPVMLDALKDVRVEEVYPGHKTLYSESLGKHLGQQWKAMYHDGSPPAEVAAKIVGDTGLMSSVKRYNSGVFTTGMSTSSDFRTGGADGVFMRVSKGVPSSAGGQFRAVIDTTKVMGRMDWWAFNHDNYGRAGYREYSQRWSVPEQTTRTSAANSSNEVMATHGVPPSAFKKFIVSGEGYRQRVLTELRKMGVSQINGTPIEQFVTT